ncbi:hypothetical protein ES332_D08G244500v1 [Gossypium tomentosum]|uniref:Uncharacterized protein n=1 Tax=Gossypium tomentosum TaxID=34277 RepID=A0A5D2JZP5_GOSTO|nr:hypothetical protein ES332_D08G244500v1 [Gossypium tomentosum]
MSRLQRRRGLRRHDRRPFQVTEMSEHADEVIGEQRGGQGASEEVDRHTWAVKVAALGG